jgi:hypothetical protein
LKYFNKWFEGWATLNDEYLFGTHRIGWAYRMNGDKEKADFHFNEQIKFYRKMKDLARVFALKELNITSLQG